MNYEANARTWNKGDLVIHDADAKEAYMLMRVIGYTREGLVKTRYVQARLFGQKKRQPRTYLNEPKYLHDPARWQINTTDVGGAIMTTQAHTRVLCPFMAARGFGIGGERSGNE